MALVPELITDRALGEPPWIMGNSRGEEGHREFLVRTHVEEAAYDAADAIGTAWSLAKPSLTLRQKKTRYVGGKDDASGEGGTTIVACDYATPGGGLLPPPTVSTKYSLIGYASETQTIYYEVGDETTPASIIPIANGNGVGILVGQTSVRIYTYAPVTSPFNFARLIRLQNKKNLNKFPITTPPVLGSPQGISVDALQMRFENFTHSIVNGLREVVIEVVLAEDFLYRWQLEAADGLAGGEVWSRQYAPADLSGLW